ncbi:MAG: hypothetical protein LBG31_01505 [Prevotellaceae bacterium]|nr:hypothetical protein [Prevotellaceae bacterium]
MRTKFFFFAMFASVMASAQSHINIEMISATYTTSPAVKFRVSWSSIPTVTGETHNAKVWVWIDFLKLNADNTTTGNTWTRAEISATPAVSSSPASTAALDASTNKGFWLNGVTGSYSATVTATLANIPANAKFNWCAYASDCPPFVIADNGTYTLQGTPPFILKAANGITQEVTEKILPGTSLTIAAVTLTDKTECPGDFCPYTGSDLYRDATHLCGHRPTGAKNWEAWIKDTRDNNLYRIVQMPDQKWYMAQNLNNRNVSYYCYGNNTTNCNEVNGVWYRPAQVSNSLCPSGWTIPNNSQWQALVDISNLTKADAVAQSKGGNDKYGLSVQLCGAHGTASQGWYSQYENWYSYTMNGVYLGYWSTLIVGCWHTDCLNYTDDRGNIRCFRQL